MQCLASWNTRRARGRNTRLMKHASGHNCNLRVRRKRYPGLRATTFAGTFSQRQYETIVICIMKARATARARLRGQRRRFRNRPVRDKLRERKVFRASSVHGDGVGWCKIETRRGFPPSHDHAKDTLHEFSRGSTKLRDIPCLRFSRIIIISRAKYYRY